MEKISTSDQKPHPAIHSLSKHSSQGTIETCEKSNDHQIKPPNMQKTSKPHLILIPHEDQSGHQHEIIQEVYRYPPESLETIVEKKGESKAAHSHKYKKKNMKKKIHSSQTSLGSANSLFSSKSVSSVTSQGDSLLSNGSSTNTLNVSDSGSTKSGHSHRGNSISFKHIRNRERNENDVMSDTSSNLSTMSDLSGYEDEYTMIKRLVSDDSRKFFTKKHLTLNESLRKKSYLETKVNEQESTIKTLNCHKEDLEIQVHRLTVQMQNAVREKEICQEHLDILQTKMTEKNQQEYFELLKVKVNLEGQNEALKQELQHYSSANSEFEAKLRQSEKEKEDLKKEYMDMCNGEKRLQERISNLEQENLKLKSKFNSVDDALKRITTDSDHYKSELEGKNEVIRELKIKCESSKKECENHLDTIKSLKKWNSEYSEREQQHRIEIKKVENLLAETSEKLNSSKVNNEWYQEQLTKTQKLYSEMQNEFAETKSSLSLALEEKDRYKREVDRINSETEDNRVKAMRDKSLLLVQLEELEADMRERESIIKRLEEGDNITHIKLSEERYRKLEEDHKQLQELKIELRDTVRHNDSLKEEMKHKIILLRKNEESLRDLRKNFAVTQEELNSKQVFIDSLNQKLNEAKIKLEKLFEKRKENEVTIGQLKEQKLQLEASTLTAERDKKQVDETIAKLKEDMSKLSSSFFRMKHDLSAKDKQIELVSSQNSHLIKSEKELLEKVSKLEAQLKENGMKQKEINDVKLLKESLLTSTNETNKLRGEISALQKSCGNLEVERKSLLNSLNLRDEQIENIQGVINTYKEKMLQKDEEIFTIKDQFSKFDKNNQELQKKFNILNNDHQLLLQEKEEFNQLEANYKNTISELKDSIKMEKRAKDNVEKKYMDSVAEFKNMSEQLQNKDTFIESLNKKINEFEKNLINFKSQESELVRLKSEVESLNEAILELQKTVSSSKAKYEEDRKIKDEELSELKKNLSSKICEIEKLEARVSDLKEKNDSQSVKYQQITPVNKMNGGKDTVKQYIMKKKTKTQKDEKPDVGNARHKKKETLNTTTIRGRDNEATDKTLSDHKALKFLYDKTIRELSKIKKEFETLKSENEALKERYLSLERNVEKVSADLAQKTEECNDWKDKFENLSDRIPQRDTDSHQKFNIDHHNFSNSYQSSVPSVIPSRQERVKNFVDMKDSCLQDFNLEERVNFNQTMFYLQKQISLAAEALKNKDIQIVELKEKLAILSSDKSELDQKIPAKSDETLFCDAATSTYEDKSTGDELQKASELEQLRKTLDAKELEFKEKKRRYESNLRLLTRKLKEHMKGRRAAEKELELIKQENHNNLDLEGKKYEILKNKYIDLEKKSQHLESEITSWESVSKDKDTSIETLTKDVERERQLVLQMQKEIGKIEQLQGCMGNLRKEINELNSEVASRNNELKETKEKLESSLEERKMIEGNFKESSLLIEEMKRELEDRKKQASEKDGIILSKQNECDQINEELSSLRSVFEEAKSKVMVLGDDLEKVKRENGSKGKEICLLQDELEAMKSCINTKTDTIEHLHIKIDVLEKEIQIKQELIDNIKSECTNLRKQLQESQEKYEDSESHLNQKLLEAKDNESKLIANMNHLRKEKLSYQTQCTELKIALNTAVEKLQASSISDLPSPSPLNTETISKLMEKCSKPKQSSNKVFNTLTERLHSLRNEVSVLQTEIKSRDQNYQT